MFNRLQSNSFIVVLATQFTTALGSIGKGCEKLKIKINTIFNSFLESLGYMRSSSVRSLDNTCVTKHKPVVEILIKKTTYSAEKDSPYDRTTGNWAFNPFE